MHGDHKHSDSLMGDLPALVLLAVVVAIGAVGFADGIAASRPAVGDIVVFAHDRQAQLANSPRDIEAFLADGDTPAQPLSICKLKTEDLAKTGGSLIVEAYDPRQSIAYRVHLGNGPAGTIISGCGADANLFVSKESLVALKAAASGTAVGVADEEVVGGL